MGRRCLAFWRWSRLAGKDRKSRRLNIVEGCLKYLRKVFLATSAVMLAGEVVIFHFLDFLHFGWRSDGGDSGRDDDAEGDELEERHIAWVSVALGRYVPFGCLGCVGGKFSKIMAKNCKYQKVKRI